VETSLPLTADRERRLLSTESTGGEHVALRVLPGDDASCLNLNRVARPGLLGVDPGRMTGRFSFTGVATGPLPQDPWTLLDADLGPDTIPAIADATVITWGLGAHLGDELAYVDEAGRTVKLRLVAGLANSIFQGSLLVSEEALFRHFPSLGGRSLFLLETPAGATAETAPRLERSLAAYGASVVSTADRLARFDSVESSYLAVFGLLGWLGMLIGTFGLGVVVARNVTESRAELAALRAFGIPRPSLVRLVLAEHLHPAVLGLAAGAAGAALAVLPASRLQGAAQPMGALLLPIGVILAAAVVVVVVAALIALRADLLPALREE
jgi:hypothetical protein